VTVLQQGYQVPEWGYSLRALLERGGLRQPGEVRYRNASDTGSEDEVDEFDESSEFMKLADLDDDDWRAFSRCETRGCSSMGGLRT
jgi:hypothetical protein